jgi:pyruvate ferredoxin oxidoreductase alpha subunit
MTLGNRAVGAPINIWNDHTDALSARDSGWLQLFVETNQQAVDVHIQAFRLAELIKLPIMVCMDGFVLTHAYERIDMPDQEQVDRFLPPFEPEQVLDPANPVSIGAMVGPEAFTEVRYLAHHKQLEALELIQDIGEEFSELFGRDSGGLLGCFDCEDAETIVVATGSVIGTIKTVARQMRAEGHSIGVVAVRSVRPFPRYRLAKTLGDAKRIIVFEKAFSVGVGGVMAQDVRWALQSFSRPLYSVIGGLGGRSITQRSLYDMISKGIKDQLPQTSFLDLDIDLVNRQLERQRYHSKPGPAAENIVRDIGALRAAKTS